MIFIKIDGRKILTQQSLQPPVFTQEKTKWEKQNKISK